MFVGLKGVDKIDKGDKNWAPLASAEGVEERFESVNGNQVRFLDHSLSQVWDLICSFEIRHRLVKGQENGVPIANTWLNMIGDCLRG